MWYVLTSGVGFGREDVLIVTEFWMLLMAVLLLGNFKCLKSVRL